MRLDGGWAERKMEMSLRGKVMLLLVEVRERFERLFTIGLLLLGRV